MGQSKDDVEVAHGEHFRLSFGDPPVAGCGLALRAMAIAAGNGDLPITCVMGSNSLWGVERGNRRKSNHSKPLFLPIKNLGLPKAGSFRGSDLS
jgi:hypothetical protein